MNRLSNKFIVVKARLQILFYILENQTIEQRFKIEFAVTLKRLENSNTRSKAVKIVLVKETQARFRLLIANLVVDMTKFAACFLKRESSITVILATHYNNMLWILKIDGLNELKFSLKANYHKLSQNLCELLVQFPRLGHRLAFMIRWNNEAVIHQRLLPLSLSPDLGRYLSRSLRSLWSFQQTHVSFFFITFHCLSSASQVSKTMFRFISKADISWWTSRDRRLR